jgi:hypothetical protein
MKKIYSIILLAHILFSSASIFAQNFSIVGNGTAANTSTSYPAPFGNYYWGSRHQFFVTAAQLSAAGIPANASISSLGFNVTATNAAAVHQGFTVRVFTTTAANPISTGWVTTGQVAQTNAVNHAPVVGWNQFNFQAPFTWNGTANLVVEVCFNNGSFSSNASTQWTTTGLGTGTWSRWFRSDATGVCANTGTTGTSTSIRPNMRFGWGATTNCSGTPNAGTASISSTIGCAGTALTLSSTGLTAGTGISYQWQSAPAAGGPWTNIAGATSTTASVTPSATTFYRLVTTCSTGGATNTTNVVSYTVSGGLCACGNYASIFASSASDTEISSVTVGSMTNNTNTCVTAAPGAGSLAGRYSNFTGSITGPTAQQGSSVPYTVVQNSCSGLNYNNIIQIYVDWNQDGVFDASERMAQSALGLNQTPGFSGNFVVPAGAIVGTTRMRIVCIEGGTADLNYAQNSTYTWGETEDYCFTVTAAVLNWKSQWILMNTGPSNWCAGETRNISVTVRNDGLQTWTNANPDINIGVKWNQEADYFVRVDANNLAPGASQTYNFTVTAPLTSGTNNLTFDVVNEMNFWFANNTNGGGPGNVVYTSAPITINALPVVSAGSGATVCPATSVQLNGSASSSQTVTIGTVTGNDLIYPFNTYWHDARTQCIILASELSAAGLTAGNITSVGFNVNFVTESVMNGFTVKMKNTPLASLANWETGLSNVYSANYTVPGLGVQTINFQNPFAWDGTSNVVIEFCFDNNAWTNFSYVDFWDTGTNRLLYRAMDGDVGCNLTAPFVATVIPVFRFSGNGNTPVSWTSSPAGFTSTVVNPTVTPSVNTTYTITAANNGCTSSANTTVAVNNPTLSTPPTNGDMVWRGTSNTDWVTLPNWWQYNGTSYVAAAAAPTTAQNVIVPANQTCVLNQPNTNANAGSAKNLRIESGATLTMGSGSLTVSENWVNNGSFVPGSGTVTFAGTGTHTISGSAAAHNFNSLTMNKTGEVQLTVPIAMTGMLTLTNGRLNIGNFNLDLPTNTINGGNANSYVRTSGTGVLMRNVGASMVNFPVGSIAYNPASLSNSGTLDKFNVRVIDNVTDDGTAVGTTTSMAVVNRTWMINEQVAGGSNVTLRLQWNGMPEEINNFAEISSFVAHFIAGEGLWDNIGGTVQSAGVIQTSGITSFSPFTVSSDNAFAPLPVELIAFTAHCQNEDVEVKWSTASEHNSQHYVLQVSEDGYDWSDLYVIEAAGFSTTVLEYSYMHKNAARTKNYYRLRQYDNDGTVETYNTIMSNCSSEDNVFMTFPNPSADAFTVVVNDKLLSGSNVLNISDASGKLIYSIAVDLENGSGSFALEGLDLPAGLYYLQLNNGSYASRIIKHSFR